MTSTVDWWLAGIFLLLVTLLIVFVVVITLIWNKKCKELKAANLELLFISGEAKRASEAKSNFLAVMSHELRTPLTAVMGYLEIISMGVHGEISPLVKQDLDRALKSSNHLLSLITDILDFIKLEGSKLTVRSAVVQINNHLESVYDLIQPQLLAKDLQYKVEQLSSSLMVKGDGERIQQILLNLLSNSIKFTPRGGAITVRSRLIGRQVFIEVEDTGIGISPAELELIFEPFKQLDIGMTRTVSGTGLGLTIARELARRMGGDLVCRSAKEAGSTFTLILPALLNLD